MKHAALALFFVAAASSWRMTHCPETGGVCHCKDSMAPWAFVAACIVGAAACFRRLLKTQVAR